MRIALLDNKGGLKLTYIQIKNGWDLVFRPSVLTGMHFTAQKCRFTFHSLNHKTKAHHSVCFCFILESRF